MKYIITFYSHFGAIRYRKKCKSEGIEATIMPVPRDLSSSCGSCVLAVGGYVMPEGVIAEEVEQVVEVLEKGYKVILEVDGNRS